MSTTHKQEQKMEAYYRFHAHIYQATRWTFLFGRNKAVAELVSRLLPDAHLLEVGCGTGQNISTVIRLRPDVQITGLDISEAMLSVSRKRFAHTQIRLLKYAFGEEALPAEVPRPAGILFSYVLTMMQPGYREAIEQASQILPPGGLIAVVDFHRTNHPFFARWMRMNHVTMEGQLLPELEQRFSTLVLEKKTVWFGLWEYLLFVGKKPR